jgi:repressor LexA
MQQEIDAPQSRLTPRQLQLLQAIAAFRASRCYSPTIGELAAQLGISRTTAFEHIEELREKNLLSGSSHRSRCLKPTSKAQKLLNRLPDGDTLQCQSQAGIPLLGRVAAGVPIEAIEDKEQLSLNSTFGSSDDVFALQVRGDSMIDDGIHDGDYAICRRASTAQAGQLVVAVVDNENATLKRFYKEKTRARLQPANENYQPIYCDNCRVEAVVIGLVRKL